MHAAREEFGRCELDDGPALPIETARRISCDSSIINITEDERGEPLDVGRKTEAFRRHCAARSPRETKAAFFRDATTNAMSMGTISSTGPTVARQSLRIS